MATTLGTVASFGNANRKTCILGTTVANVAAPTTANDGVPMYPTNALASTEDGACYTGRASREAHVAVIPTAGATPTGVFTLYGYIAAADGGNGKWVPIQKLNAGAAITASYSERVLNVGHFDRLAVGLASIGGTSTAYEVWFLTSLSGCE